MAFPLLTAEEQASLVARIRDGREDAEARLVELFSRPVRLMVRVRGRSLEDEDVTQEVLMTAITAVRRGQLREAERLGAFVAGLARNVINNRLRGARGPACEPLTGHENEVVADLRHELAVRDRLEMVRQALGALGAQDRRILQMSLIDGLRASQIAEELGVTEETVRARKSRALRRLKGRFET